MATRQAILSDVSELADNLNNLPAELGVVATVVTGATMNIVLEVTQTINGRSIDPFMATHPVLGGRWIWLWYGEEDGWKSFWVDGLKDADDATLDVHTLKLTWSEFN